MRHPATKWVFLALILAEAMDANPARARGNMLAALRRAVVRHEHGIIAPRCRQLEDVAAWQVSYLNGQTPDAPGALPILHDDTRVLIDALCFKRGFTRREDAWASLGISNNTGAGWVNPNKPGMMRWSPFAALRTAVMEGE